MLLAFASLGAGVSAEDCNDQMTDLEELGVLELSIDERGVVEAVITQDALLSFMDSDEEAVLGIESIDVTVTLDEDGNLVLCGLDLGIGEEQRNEINVTLRLSEDLVEILLNEDIDLHHLLVDLGFGDDLGLDDFDPEVEDDYDEDYWDSRIYWADEAYQVRGSQNDYDRVMDAEDPAEEFFRVLEEFEENYDEFVEDTLGARIHWADEAYQLRGSQDDYDRVMDAEDPADEFYTIYEEMMQAWEEDESGDDWNETEEDDGVEEEVPTILHDQCERGLLRGAFTVDEDGNGTMRGLVMDEDGNVISNMWGAYNTDGFAHGFGGADNLTDVKWKAVYEDGRFTGLWKMIDENDSMNGMLKGHYELNETGDGGVFHGKWKESDCRNGHDMDERDTLPPVVDTEPRHSPLRVDAERVDDIRQVDKTPEPKPLMDKLGEVMDKPLVEDEEGGMVINVGEAAAGSTLGTIALLGAGFLRRRITGGL